MGPTCASVGRSLSFGANIASASARSNPGPESDTSIRPNPPEANERTVLGDFDDRVFEHNRLDVLSLVTLLGALGRG